LVGKVSTPSQAAVRAESLRQLEEALGQMDPIDQEVLALRHFEELTNTEISELLGIEQKAASIRYVRAIARLRNVLAGLPGFFNDFQGKF
jgi:RNA polymerase sigma-70 factor (ECF subfamily)